MSSLLGHLDRPDDARLVIVVADGLGESNAANIACFEALRDGLATTAGLQMPCPWSRGARAMYRGEDLGVSLTLNAEHDSYRWGPMTQAPSLLDGDGGFPRTPDDLWEHADPEETLRECRAQIERAILWGFDISHLSAHLNGLDHTTLSNASMAYRWGNKSPPREGSHFKSLPNSSESNATKTSPSWPSKCFWAVSCT